MGTIIEAPDSHLNVPAVCDVEVCSALRRIVRAGELDAQQASAALSHYLALPLIKHGHTVLVARIFELRDNFSAYDAAYVALAERLGATLVTGDGRMTRAAQDHLTLNVIGVST